MQKKYIDTIGRINERRKNYNVLGFIDEEKELKGKYINGVKVLGGDDVAVELSHKKDLFGVIAIASSSIKRKIVNRMGQYIIWENIIDPSVCISKNMYMGEGNVIQPGVIICADVKMGNHCILNMGVTLGHDSILEDYVSITA